MFIEMPVLDHGVVAAVMIFAPLLEIMVLATPLIRAVSAAWRLIPQDRLPLFGQIVVEALAQDHTASASILRGLVYGRTAPPSPVRRRFQAPTLVVGHPRDPLHPFSDADMLVKELPHGTLLEAESLIELRAKPDRLTPQIGDWLDAVWRGEEAGSATVRPKARRARKATATRRPVSRTAGGVTRRARATG